MVQLLLVTAELHRNQKHCPTALKLARQALRGVTETWGSAHLHAAYPLREIGRNYLQQRRFGEAEPNLRRSYEILGRRLEAGHPDIAQAQLSLAKCRIGLGRYAEAESLLLKARTTLRAVYGPGVELSQEPEKLLAEIRSRRGKG